MNIDPDRSADVIRAAKPGIVTFGGSLFLFPHPIKELKEVCNEVGAYVAYDAAHVLGLIAGGQFQDPLREGADFITSSTHKTFPGPQGGVVMGSPTNPALEKAVKKIQFAIFPLSIQGEIDHHDGVLFHNADEQDDADDGDDAQIEAVKQLALGK